MRKQIKLIFQLGYQVQPDRRHVGFERKLVEAASRMCGGCTASIKQGWWADDGGWHPNRFEVDVIKERCFDLELTCELDEVDRVLEEMRDQIVKLTGAWKIQTDWVYVYEVEMTGRHFSIN